MTPAETTQAVIEAARAYRAALVVEDRLYATVDGWDNGPLPWALDVRDEGDADPDRVVGADDDGADGRIASFCYRDGGPAGPPFDLGAAAALCDETAAAGLGPEAGALLVTRRVLVASGYGRSRVAEAAGLLLVVLGHEGR
jgi:hypothetical protein